jgi:hypothetical protein
MYEEVRAAVTEILDPARPEYVVVPHFEADECAQCSASLDDEAGGVDPREQLLLLRLDHL